MNLSPLLGVVCPIAHSTLKLGIVLLTEGNTKIQGVSLSLAEMRLHFVKYSTNLVGGNRWS